jgi:hypothetical protein
MMSRNQEDDMAEIIQFDDYLFDDSFWLQCCEIAKEQGTTPNAVVIEHFATLTKRHGIEIDTTKCD